MDHKHFTFRNSSVDVATIRLTLTVNIDFALSKMWFLKVHFNKKHDRLLFSFIVRLRYVAFPIITDFHYISVALVFLS